MYSKYVCIMNFIPDIILKWFIVESLTLLLLLGSSSAAPQSPLKSTTCDSNGSSFEEGHVYTYDYTVKISSAFLGASNSKAGSMLTCTVTINVPAKCEHDMQLSDCKLSERHRGADDIYTEVLEASKFLQDLEKYMVHFQMSNGKLHMDSISVDDRDTLQVLNIKRGIISALQFPVLERDEYNNQKTKTDIFGECPVQYHVLGDNLNQIESRRKISHCILPNVHAKQVNLVFGPSIGQMTGGFVEEPITEMMYPFETVVSCLHVLDEETKPSAISCLQKHYFEPLTNQGDPLLTAMTNISQDLKLSHVVEKEIVTQSQMYDGMSLKNIKFEFGDEFYRTSTLMQLHETLFALGEKFVQLRKRVEIETIPGMFGNLVQSFRSANRDTLKDLMVDVFDCPADCTDKAKVAAQVFFLDGLESCGTDACILTFLLCMNQGHTTRFQTAAFIHALKDIAHVSDNIISELHKYCIKSDETQCWLTLGSILSKSSLSDLKEGSTLYKVLESSNAILDDNCNSHVLQHSERKLNTVVKTAKNIGYILNMAFLSKSMAFLEFPAKIEKCLHNSVISNTIKISLLQFVEDSIEIQNFRDLSRGTVDALFTTLKDVTMDSAVRALSFSILTKTTDKKTIQALVKFMLKRDNTHQMKTYMTSAVKSLLEDDSPDLKEVRASWENVRKEEYFNPHFPLLDSYSYWSSKHVGAASFYKLPVTDIFGGQVAADLIFDPSSSIFSTLRTKFNFYYGEKKHRLFECMVRLKGFDLLLHVILKRINMSYQEMYALYKDLKTRARSNNHSYNEQFANFQANIVNAVEDILSEVNHSHELDFDFFVEIAVKGKDVAFISLKELISELERIQSTLPPNVSIFQTYLRKLFEKISFSTFKSKEVMSIVRDIPTCAGLPLNMTVNAFGTHIIDSSFQSDLLLYMAKKSPTLSASVNPAVSLVHEVRGVLAVPFGIAHSSGMEERILFGTETEVALSLKLGYNDPKVAVENPSKKKLVLEFQPVRKDMEGQSQRMFYVRGVMQLHHLSGAETVQRHLTTDVSRTICSHDSWIAVIFRKKMCMKLAYPDVLSSRANIYFLLSGPFDLGVSVEDLDSIDFPVHKWTLEYELEKQAGAGYIDSIYITHDAIFGEQISQKYGYMKVMYIRDDCSVTISSHIPDFHYSFNANFTNNWKGRMFEFTVAEVLTRYGLAVTAFVFKLQGNNYGERKEFKYHWNVTTPGIGLDVQFVASGKGDFPNFVDKSAEVSVTYHCTKDSILYMLHLIPSLAMENHDISKFYLKSSSYSLEGGSKKTVAIIELYGRKLSADCLVEKMGPATKARAVLTYKVNGITKTATSDFVWTWGQSDAGLTLDLSSDLTSSDFSIDATGSCTASQTDVTLSGEIHYQNNAEENLLKREKRFMKIAYEKLKEIEEATVNNVMKIKKKMFGTTEKDMQETEKENGSLQKLILKQLQDSNTVQTSIWDYQKWHANVVFSAAIAPVYGENIKVEGQSPEGMEAIGALRIKHPWNGGYIQHMKNFTIGKNMQNTFRDFKFWFSGILTTAFVSVDGTPIVDSSPIVDGRSSILVIRQGGFIVKREVGKLFDYSMSYHGPDINKEYSVSFNWDAFGHNEPLIHVKSDETNLLLPFLNHHYEETLFYEPRHIKHAMTFSHEVVKFDMETDIRTFGGIAVTQNGSVSLQLKVLAEKWQYEFMNKAENGKLECAFFPSSTPNNIVIFVIEFADSTSFFLKKAVKKTAEANKVHMSSTEISLKGSSMIKVTHTWSEAYQKNMKNSLKQELISMAMNLQTVGDQQMSKIDKPLLDQPIIFISTTPREIIKLNIMPNIISGMSFWCRIVGNLIPVRYNPSKYDALLQAVDTAHGEEPDPTVRKIQYLIYLGMKISGKFLETFGKSSTYSTRIEDIITQRQYSYVFSTNPFIFKSITDVPDLAQHGKHFVQQIKEMFGLAVRYYKDKTILQKSSTSVAVLFGRHDPYRELNVQTFDGSLFEIPAEETAEYSFLLASDLRQRRWSLVLTTAGVTLLTPSKTVTVGWNKNIYLDNCKIPSAENLIQSQDGKVTVEREDGTIHLDTTFNLKLEFDTTHDICLITVEGPYRNETIGLLGTNDREKFTDYRMRDGLITSDINELLAEYVLSGQNNGILKGKEMLRKKSDSCGEVYEQCIGLFQEHYSPMYTCFSTGTNFPYNQFCENAALRCEDHEMNFCYGLKALKDICSKKGLLNKPISLKGICQNKNRVSQSLKSNSLDIVFVVSQHVEMMAMRDSSLEYVFELANIDAWTQLDKVRFGVVLFGGSTEKVTVQRNGNCLLCERDNYDWESLFDETEVTEGGLLSGDAFEAIQEATTFPFNPVAHKMVIVLMTKEQSSRHTPDLDNIKADLQEMGITLNVVSTYIKTRSRRILGINWNNLIIAHKSGYNGQKSLPKNDYCALVTATRGALWDLISVFDDYEATSRMVEELVAQTSDHTFCQAA